MRQKISIVINTGETPAYELVEKRPKGQGYEALRHFFEDIGIKVESLTISQVDGEHKL